MKEITITKNDANQRLDKFLWKTYPQLGKSMMYKAIRNKKIKVNRKRCEFNQTLVEGDHILLFLPPDVLVEKEREVVKALPIDIVYEDENLLIVNKPYGLLSQSDTKESQDCLVTRVQSYLFESGQWDPNAEHAFAPTICHRLDRNTQGLVVAAKNAQALRIMNEAISNRKVHKFYKAWIDGQLDAKDVFMQYYLKKEGTKAVVKDRPASGFVEAKMKVHVIDTKESKSLIEVELMTGRFHQIRALMAHIHHPLCHDFKYGSKKKGKYFLQAYRLDLSEVDLPLQQKIFEIKSK